MVQKKRKQGSGNQAAPKKQKQDGQKAVSKDINIPIDEGFRENGELVFPILKPVPASSPTIPVTGFNNVRGQGPTWLPYAWPNQNVELLFWEARLTPCQPR